MVEERIAYIYTLSDPRTNEVRYIGMTVEPKKRLKTHLAARTDNYRDRWIRSLRAEGCVPAMSIVEQTTADIAPKREQYWVAAFRGQGASLTNLTDGGEGSLGYVFSAEQREKIAASLRGRKHTDERRERIRESLKGRKMPADFGARISAAQLGRKHSEETKQKIRAAKLGKPQHPDVGRKVSAALTGRSLDPAVKAKISATMKAKRSEPGATTAETRKKLSESSLQTWADGKHTGHGEKMRAFWRDNPEMREATLAKMREGAARAKIAKSEARDP